MTLRPLLAVFVAAALTACGGTSTTSDPAPEGLAVTIEPPSAIAGGNGVLVTVTGNIQYPLHLSTTRGYWVGTSPASQIISIGSPTTPVNAATLTSCAYSASTPWCAGVAEVYASDSKQSGGRAYVTFYP